MPGPDQELMAPETVSIRVALEPVQNAFESLVMLAKHDNNNDYGVGDWITHTFNALALEERKRHQLVMIGLHYTVLPERSWSSFPAYLENLASYNPRALRDKMIMAYLRLAGKPADGQVSTSEVRITDVDLDDILKDKDSYLQFLRERFDEKFIDEEMERWAYTYVVDPPALRDLVVSHMQFMWDKHLAAEWERVQSMLQDSVNAFQQVDLAGKTKTEAFELVTGQTPNEHMLKSFDCSEQVIFVPSAHIGPYIGQIWSDKRLWVLFGARIPEGVRFHAPDLSRAEIVVRLSALADDNRLYILQMVGEQGELTSQEIMSQLGLSQSAASRHLKQLSANGYLAERRCNGAKCFKLNSERIEGTLQAVSNFLLSG